MDLVEQTGIDKTTASRLLALMVDRGFLVRSPETRRYLTGPGLLGLTVSFDVRLALREVCSPHLVRLRAETGETVSLHLRVGDHRVCIDGAESTHAVRRVVPWGESIPLYAGPSGKVILAQLADADVDRILQWAAAAGQDRSSIEAALDGIRADGYALTIGDRTPGVCAVSVCITDGAGPLASLTVAGPADRWTRKAATEAVASVVDAAGQVSTSMGGRHDG